MALELFYGRLPSGIFSPSSIVLMALLIAAAITDMLARTIPNELIAIGLLVALIASVSNGFLGIGFMLLGCLGGFLFFLPVYLSGQLGAGDVKLMAVIGGFLGLHQLLVASIFVFLVGGCVALFMMLRLPAVGVRKDIPYATAIAGGVGAHLVLFG